MSFVKISKFSISIYLYYDYEFMMYLFKQPGRTFSACVFLTSCIQAECGQYLIALKISEQPRRHIFEHFEKVESFTHEFEDAGLAEGEGGHEVGAVSHGQLRE